MNTNIIESLRYGYEAFSRGDIQGAVDALDLSPDIIWSEPEDFYASGTYRGHKGVAEYLTLSYESSEKVKSLPEEILEVGDKIFVLVHFQAWPKGGGQPREGHIAESTRFKMGRLCRCKPIETLKRHVSRLGFCRTAECSLVAQLAWEQ